MAVKLPIPDWATTDAGARLIAALGCAEEDSRLVGGTVRDALIGVAHADIDFATRLRPEAVMQRLEAASIKVVPTGIAHGTVTAVAGGLVAEITTLRRDVSTDGRRATIAYTDDWREDAGRRDFTINALFASLPSGEINDFFGGIDDLNEGRVRFIGEPLARIAEDHLRILRFFRFHGRFAAGAPDTAALAACAARANDLMALSRERIRDELLRILVLPRAAETLRLMLNHGILTPVLPELDRDRLPALQRLAALEEASGVGAGALRRLAVLLPADVALLVDMGARLRLSRREAEHLAGLAQRLPALPDAPLVDAYWSGWELAGDRLLLLGAETSVDVGVPYAALAGWERPKLPVSGRDFIARGVVAGPEVSARVRAFETAWVVAGFPVDREAVERLMDLAGDSA